MPEPTVLWEGVAADGTRLRVTDARYFEGAHDLKNRPTIVWRAIYDHWHLARNYEEVALRTMAAELAEARLAAAVADGTATPEMLRDAGLLEGWSWDGFGEWVLDEPLYAWAANGIWRVREGLANVTGGEENSTLANLRAADAAVRKLLAEGEAAE